MLFQDRLAMALKHADVSAADLARHLGIAQQAISAALRGRTKAFNAANLLKTSMFLKVSPMWLATGTGDMPLVGASGLVSDSLVSRPVPVIGKLAEGLSDRIGTAMTQVQATADLWADVTTGDPHAFLIEVDNDAMHPRYNPGEFALIEPNTAIDLEDDVMVKLTTGQVMLRRLQSRRAGLRLVALNPAIAPLHLAEAEVAQMFYVAHAVPRKRARTRKTLT
jgi:phage repressor protein C with HTH and peptisase S24 domain